MTKLTAKIGDLCTIYAGTGFPIQYQGETDGDFPFFKVGDISRNVSNGHIYLKDCGNFISREVARKIKGTIIPTDTVVFAKIGEAVKLNRRAITAAECLVDNNAMGICPDQSRVLLSYFYHFMCSIRLENYAEATTVPSVKKSVIEKIEIPLPSIEEQQRISDRLDEIDNLIQLRKQQHQQLEQLVKSRFIELFGEQKDNPNSLPVGKLADVADIYLGLTHTPTYVQDGTPFLSVKDISSGYISFSNCHYITEQEYQSLPNGAKPRAGDILFCRVGTIGKPVIIPDDTPAFGTFVSVGYLRKKSQVNNAYLKSWMEDAYFMQQVYDNVAGASQINLNTGWLKNFRILIPPMELQNEFAAFVEQTDKLKFAVKEITNELQNNLLQAKLV